MIISFQHLELAERLGAIVEQGGPRAQGLDPQDLVKGGDLEQLHYLKYWAKCVVRPCE